MSVIQRRMSGEGDAWRAAIVHWNGVTFLYGPYATKPPAKMALNRKLKEANNKGGSAYNWVTKSWEVPEGWKPATGYLERSTGWEMVSA